MESNKPNIIRFTMTRDMDFTQAVTEFLKVFRKAAEENPEADRHVYLDIEEHIEKGDQGWTALDNDSFDFVQVVAVKSADFWKEFHCPPLTPLVNFKQRFNGPLGYIAVDRNGELIHFTS